MKHGRDKFQKKNEARKRCEERKRDLLATNDRTHTKAKPLIIIII